MEYDLLSTPNTAFSDDVREESSGTAVSASPPRVEMVGGPSQSDPLQKTDEDLHEAPEEPVEGLPALSEELRDQIVRQVEYYFSDENLATDAFLFKFIKKDNRGFVPIKLIASFKRMKKLTQDLSLIEAALRTSSKLGVSSDGKKVRRLHPLPLRFMDSNDSMLRTVLVEILPVDCSADNIQMIFGEIGKVANVVYRDPNTVDDSTMKKANIVTGNKVYALVEYKNVEDAEKAVVVLNDEKNWRSMRVERLSKRMEKHGKHFNTDKEMIAINDDSGGSGETALDEGKLQTGEQDEEDNRQGSSKSRRSNRQKGHKGHKQQTVSAQVFIASGHGGGRQEALSKPLPGPRMPDGTRGFVLGRGKLCAHDQSQTDQE